MHKNQIVLNVILNRHSIKWAELPDNKKTRVKQYKLVLQSPSFWERKAWVWTRKTKTQSLHFKWEPILMPARRLVGGRKTDRWEERGKEGCGPASGPTIWQMGALCPLDGVCDGSPDGTSFQMTTATDLEKAQCSTSYFFWELQLNAMLNGPQF